MHKADNELVERIIDQKLSLGTVINLLEQHKSNPDVKDVLIDIYALDKIYKDVQISVSEVESVSREGESVTTLRSKNVVSVSPDVFNNLKTKIKEIRTKYTM